jgi:DNA-binding PucR family transcriptional regulator
VDAVAASLRDLGTRPRRAIIGLVHAMVFDGPLPSIVTIPDEVTLGVGTTAFAAEVATSFEQAVRAVRYATSRAGAGATARPIVHTAELGPFDFLAGALRSKDIRGLHDLDVLDGLAACPNGQGVIQTLEALAEAGSLREAARRMHLHHNSIAARVRRAEELLGYKITEPAGGARLQLTLALRRLRSTDLLA